MKTNEKVDGVAIKVTGLHKSFKLPMERVGRLKQALINILKGVRGYKKQQVLKGIDFEVKKGEFFGIVGRNGSGKSTLLKFLAGIYTPDKGKIEVNGTLVPFIELGVGFNPELTGRENVYLNGALLGFSNKEIDTMYDEIVEFAELGQFMEQKLKNYSSGMQVRLAFSIAIQAKGDILVLDEVLAVGDEAFQRKCNEFFAGIKQNQEMTVILVTHDMNTVRQYCNRAIFIEKGKIVGAGNPNKIADEYSAMFLSQILVGGSEGKNRFGTGEVRFENISYKLTHESFILDFDIKNYTTLDFKDVAMGFDFAINREIITGFNTRYTNDFKNIFIEAHGEKHFCLTFANVFGNHFWELDINMTTNFGTNITDHIKPALTFQSNNTKYHPVFRILNVPKIKISEKK